MEMEQERLLPQDEIVAEPLFCRRLRVARHCEVQFLQQVRALEMHVEGTVHGDILCDGTLYLASTGVLEGTVAARSLRVEDGAELRAKTTVLVEPLEPLVRRERIWQWRCDNPTGRAECARVLLEPHA